MGISEENDQENQDLLEKENGDAANNPENNNQISNNTIVNQPEPVKTELTSNKSIDSSSEPFEKIKPSEVMKASIEGTPTHNNQSPSSQNLVTTTTTNNSGIKFKGTTSVCDTDSGIIHKPYGIT